MYLSGALSTLLLATLVSSRSLFGVSDQVVINDDDGLKVPGDNPLYFCEDPKDYIGHVTNVNLSPNPPVPGEKLYIVANGTLTEPIEEGSKVHLTVKFNNFITLINTDADVCENLPKVDLECPVKKGELNIAKEADIPKLVPKGKYDVYALATNKGGETITCMKAAVIFH